MSIEKALIVDDDSIMRNFIAETLRRSGLDVTTAENGQKAFNLLKAESFDLLVTDMKMPDISGLDVLKKAKELHPHILVIVVTAFATVENAVEAMRLGAYNYLIKPFSPDSMEAIVRKAKEHVGLVSENQYLRQEVANGCRQGNHRIIGESPPLKKILEDVSRIAVSNANVLISGESGTGKEVIAQAIHNQSLRANRPFIKVNCAAVPETLLESEFFGHEKGAFTGANAKRLGRFELAHTGTLLLDEVTEIPISLQAKLLRVIQEQEFERVGGSKPVKVDVRIISTSNRDLKEAVKDKILREDLYYRLNVVPIHLPALRERKEDVLLLAEYFLDRFGKQNNKEPKLLSDEAKEKLLHYSWPGNVRELSNVIERAIVMDTNKHISAAHLYLEDLKSSNPNSSGSLPIGLTLEELEKRMIIETLHAYHSDPIETAKTLGITLRKLNLKLKSILAQKS